MQISFGNYGQERDVNATAAELYCFDVICAELRAAGCDVSGIRLTRKSDSYVTAVLDDYDLARFKYTDRTSWITLPLSEHRTKRLELNSPDEIEIYLPELLESFETIKRQHK